MKPSYRLLWIICCYWLVVPNPTHSQSANDTIPKRKGITRNKKDTATYLHYIYAGNTHETFSRDTSLNGFQHFNPACQQPNAHSYLGNIGNAHHPLVFTPLRNIEFDWGYHQFDLYTYQLDEVKYYHTTSPYTDITFALGRKEEQFFKLIHTQNIKPNINIGFDYRKISSEGLYQREKTSNQALNIFGWYRTPSQRYNLLLAFTYNKARVQENGGIGLDTLFEDNAINKFYFQRQAVPVRLLAAENLWSKKGTQIKQSWDFGKKYHKQINDTVSIQMLLPVSSISHTFSFQNNGFSYKDAAPDTVFYPTIYFSLYQTLDTAHFYQYENRLAFQLTGNKKRESDSIYLTKNILEAEVRHSIYQIRQWPGYDTARLDTSIQNGTAIIRFGSNPKTKSKFFHQLNVQYGLMGYHQDDYWISEKVGLNLGEKTGRIYLKATAQQINPVWIAQHYRSNHFLWDLNFKKTKIWSGNISYEHPNSHLETQVTAYVIENLIYWYSMSYPKQANEPLQVIIASLKKDFTWKHLHFNNLLVAHFFSSGKYIHLPPFSSRHSLFYQNHFFKKVLFAQVGLDVRYTTDYFADAYMPVTGQFYWQNKKELSFYPVADFFLNLKVKRARLFFKVENLNQQLQANGYYAVPYYPMPDRAFKAGINWVFFD